MRPLNPASLAFLHASMPSKGELGANVAGQPDSPPDAAWRVGTGLPDGQLDLVQASTGPRRAAQSFTNWPLAPIKSNERAQKRDGDATGFAPVAPRPLSASEPLGIGSIRGQTDDKGGEINGLAKSELLAFVGRQQHELAGVFHVEVYPAGVKLEKALGYALPAPKADRTRGAIEGFTDKSARRLREFFMTYRVEGQHLFAVTFTTHKACTAAEWRAIEMRFRQAVRRANYAGSYRVELQRRKTPHLHCGMWLPDEAELVNLRELWLRATREQNDPAAREHAMLAKAIPHDETGWAVYMGLHDGKHKTEQLGWKGKQWGVWNRSAFTKREPQRYDLNRKEHAMLLRILARMDRSKREHLKRQKQMGVDFNHPFVLALARRGKCEDLRRPRLPSMHRGNLLRCVEGAKVALVIEAMQAGRIGLASGGFHPNSGAHAYTWEHTGHDSPAATDAQAAPLAGSWR